MNCEKQKQLKIKNGFLDNRKKCVFFYLQCEENVVDYDFFVGWKHTISTKIQQLCIFDQHLLQFDTPEG